MKRESGRTIGKWHVTVFKGFIKRITEHGDWSAWTDRNRSRLLRVKICDECKFSRSVLLQNPCVRSLLFKLERKLISEGKIAISNGQNGLSSQLAESDPKEILKLLADKIEALETRLKLYNNKLETFEQKRIAIMKIWSDAARNL